jgi:hypothetical protein
VLGQTVLEASKQTDGRVNDLTTVYTSDVSIVLHHLQLPHFDGFVGERPPMLRDVQPMFAFWFNFLKENRRSSQASQGRFRFLKTV